MDTLTLQLTFFDVVRMLWAMAFGACVGSLINVLVYRIPRGLDFVTPTSRCPNCSTKLTWRENIPIFGWLFLGGRCRFCRSPISREYPIVEAVVALLWGVAFMACYSDASTPLHALFRWMQPEWARGGFVQTWPLFAIVITIISCLVAMTLVDAKTFTIPEQLTTFPTIFGLVVHPLAVLWVWYQGGRLAGTAPGYDWSIWTPQDFDWWYVGAALGGGVGMALANLLLRKNILKRSFTTDYILWEQQTLQQIEQEQLVAKQEIARKTAAGEPLTPEDQAAADPTQQEMWYQYPYARREMLRELLFLGVIVAVASVGGMLAHWLAGPWVMNVNSLQMEPTDNHVVPLWLKVVSGSWLGYFVGAGLVWVVRILGSLAFNKEALGLGDVHMMGAVGACLGLIDPSLAFFLAAFLGMGGWGLQLFTSGKNQRMLPYGPFLALATLLVWYGKPLVELLASKALGDRVNWP